MADDAFDRWRIRFRSVKERTNKFRIDDIAIDADSPVPPAGESEPHIEAVAEEIRVARSRGAPVMICHGAHLIKNGLGPLLVRFVEEGWLTHVATNGAGSIHDWEFAFLGSSCEDVRDYVSVGEFGIWDETGSWIALALLLGALEGRGYGASIGRMISEERLEVPHEAALREKVASVLGDAPSAESSTQAAAAAELLGLTQRANLEGGTIEIAHQWKRTSVQRACYDRSIPLTVHPGIGQDIIYTHPWLLGGAVGRGSVSDFLRYASSVENLSGGVYLSVGSSVMSPMVFEKSLSMARNVHLQQQRTLDDFSIVVNDLAESTWDWSQGEPPVDNPAYYVRFCKTFSRMGGRLRYIGLDNRVFLQNLYAKLKG